MTFNKIRTYGGFFLFILLLQSCIPTKKLIYLQNDHSTVQPHGNQAYRFNIFDRIYIDIKTRDEQINKLLSGKTTTQNISGQNTYFMTYHVDKDGNIDLPVIGKMKAAGKTAEELKQDIKNELLKKFFRHPEDVYVKVLPAGINVTVLGEVGHSGTILMLEENPDLLKAIAQAGDIQLTGDRTDVMIIRQLPDGTRQIEHLDLTKRNVMNSPFFYLQNNDVVYVKPLPQKTIGTGTTFISTLTTVFSIVSFGISIYLFSIRTK